MGAKTTALRIVCAFSLVAATALRPSAQTAGLPDALLRYAHGDFASVAVEMRTFADAKIIQKDLDTLAKTWLAGKGPVPGALARRALTGFALEAAATHVGAQPGPSIGLLEWACKIVRIDTKPDDFDRRWQRAALAVLEGAIAPNALESHIAHVQAHLGNEPRILLASGLASEQRTAPFATDGDIKGTAEYAIKKYQVAQKVDAVRAEASLRIGYLDVRLGRTADALTALDDVEPHTTDGALIYLARVFRGQALDAANRPADAEAAYRSALALVPGAHSATIPLAALLFREERRPEASALVDGLLTSPRSTDPWWGYWPGDFRMIDQLIADMRPLIK